MVETDTTRLGHIGFDRYLEPCSLVVLHYLIFFTLIYGDLLLFLHNEGPDIISLSLMILTLSSRLGLASSFALKPLHKVHLEKSLVFVKDTCGYSLFQILLKDDLDSIFSCPNCSSVVLISFKMSTFLYIDGIDSLISLEPSSIVLLLCGIGSEFMFTNSSSSTFASLVCFRPLLNTPVFPCKY